MNVGRFVGLLLVLALPVGSAAQKKSADVYTDPDKAGPDFKVQGEYVGEIAGEKYGAQVVALGDGKFDLYFLKGGLPGAGWDGKTRTRLPVPDPVKRTFTSRAWNGEIGDGKITGETADKKSINLKHVERKSPTVGAKPPDGAVVLFDGGNVDEWVSGKLVEGNLLKWGTHSKKGFGAGKLHVEFRTPFQPKARGQGRGNSGVYIHNTEIQVLDSFGLTGANNECGAFYGFAKPAVNMCLPPLSWQTYDVEVKPGPKEGELLATVWHNGVKVHEDFRLKGAASKPVSILLQDHGNPVAYRNIWFVSPKSDSSGD
jgi:hypothetical protein